MAHNRKKIIIVDDSIVNLTIGASVLKPFYDVYTAPSAAKMFEILKRIRPDLILLDIAMPDMDGYAAIKKLKSIEQFANTPVIFLTSMSDVESELKGFELGGADYISQPFSPPLLLKRIEHQLLIIQQKETIQYHVDNLTALVSEKVSEVFNLQNAIMNTVSDLVEFRDSFTGGHIVRTKLYMKTMIKGMLNKGLYKDVLSNWNMDFILPSVQLHDVGKIAISDNILNKPARLTSDEYDIMKTHVVVGINAVNKIISNTTKHTFLRHVLNIVGTHHEKWDGTGYPNGIKGEDIPLEGRLMAVADVYDALVSKRPYKDVFTHEKAMEIIKESRGTHFDPILVDAFLSVEDEFKHITKANPENSVVF